jgi:DNA-directed RNA polymerase specialized sigma24 family protein
VLQQQQCIVQKLVDGRLRNDADDATHEVLLKAWVQNDRKLRKQRILVW